MAGHELAYGGGKWHGAVDAEMKKLRAEGLLHSEELDEDALAYLQTLPYVETLMVLKTMQNKPTGEDTCAWIVKECEAVRQKFGTVKEKNDYAAAELLVKCSEKAAKASELKQKASGGAAPERPSERFAYKRTRDGSRIKFFKPTTKDDPVVISD